MTTENHHAICLSLRPVCRQDGVSIHYPFLTKNCYISISEVFEQGKIKIDQHLFNNSRETNSVNTISELFSIHF